MKKAFLYIMALMYGLSGIYHFINPLFYIGIMPEALPYKEVFNYFAGVVEIGLAVMLLWQRTRPVAIVGIILMLVIFLFSIHLPMVISYYNSDHPALWLAILRLPIQFVLIWWAWLYAKPEKT